MQELKSLSDCKGTSPGRFVVSGARMLRADWRDSSRPSLGGTFVLRRMVSGKGVREGPTTTVRS